MKGLYLTLGFAKFGRGSEALAEGFSVYLASQTGVGPVAGLARLMAVTIWFSTTALDGGNGAVAEITQLEDLRQDAGALLFQAGDGVRQRAPLNPNVYIRSDYIDKKRKQPNPPFYVAHPIRNTGDLHLAIQATRRGEGGKLVVEAFHILAP